MDNKLEILKGLLEDMLVIDQSNFTRAKNLFVEEIKHNVEDGDPDDDGSLEVYSAQMYAYQTKIAFLKEMLNIINEE
jgi:hypothetical protein